MIKKVKKIIDVDENDEKNREDQNKNINNENNNKVINNNTNENKENKESNKESILNNDDNIIKENIKENESSHYDKKEISNKEEDPIVSYMSLKDKITDDDIKNSSKILLEEINCDLFNGKKIEINAGGMVGGRNKKDGFSIFGQKNIYEESDSENSKSKDENLFYPDYELNYSPFLSYPYIFAIYFKKEEKSFYIKSYSGKGSDNKVLFVKIDNKKRFILNQKELILSGNMIFQVTPIKESSIEVMNLSKRKYNICNKHIFDGNIKKKFTIGRQKDCDFSFPKDKCFSRCQTTFEFDKEINKWTIIDGNNKKASTNGSWIFGTHSFLIKGEMIVEILNCQIRIIEVKSCFK